MMGTVLSPINSFNVVKSFEFDTVLSVVRRAVGESLDRCAVLTRSTVATTVTTCGTGVCLLGSSQHAKGTVAHSNDTDCE